MMISSLYAQDDVRAEKVMANINLSRKTCGTMDNWKKD